MKIFKVGDSQKVICEHCGSLQTAIFKLCDVPLSDGSGTVNNVLAGVCDECGQVCLLPHQSTPAVRRQLEAQRRSVESRLPAHLIDILSLAVCELGGTADFVPSLMKYYIHRLAKDPQAAAELSVNLKSELAQGKSDKRLSLKGRRVSEELDFLKAVSHISHTTDLIKSVIIKINEDVLVKKSPGPLQELKSIVAAVA